jgi:hypothetical protein
MSVVICHAFARLPFLLGSPTEQLRGPSCWQQPEPCIGEEELARIWSVAWQLSTEAHRRLRSKFLLPAIILVFRSTTHQSCFFPHCFAEYSSSRGGSFRVFLEFVKLKSSLRHKTIMVCFKCLSKSSA